MTPGNLDKGVRCSQVLLSHCTLADLGGSRLPTTYTVLCQPLKDPECTSPVPGSPGPFCHHLDEPVTQWNDLSLSLCLSLHSTHPLAFPKCLGHPSPPQICLLISETGHSAHQSVPETTARENGGCLSQEGVINVTVLFLTASLFFLA